MRTALAIVLVLLGHVAHAEKPTESARAILDTQLEALRTDATKWPATFSDDALILGLATDQPASSLALRTVIFDRIVNGPGEITKTKVASLVAGGDDKTLWWTAEVVFSGTLREAGTTTPTWTEKFRFSELATSSDGKAWKVVAAAFDQGRKDLPEVSADDVPDKLAGATEAGALSALLASPASVASSISTAPSTFVIGSSPKERGVGKAAKKTLAGWRKLSLAVVGTPREVHTATYGFAQGFVDWKHGKTTYRMLAVIFAVPRADGSWQPVGLHYQ
jgi:hypothetical protein